MGNRAIIRFDDDTAPELYLHWNGGPESVLAFVEYTAEKMGNSHNHYFPARLTQVIGNFYGGTLSLQVSSRPLFIDVENVYTVTLSPELSGPFDNPPAPYISERNGKPFTKADADKARAHDYWADDQVMNMLRAKNDGAFTE